MAKTVLVDIDDTLADAQPAILAYVNARSRTPLAYEQYSRAHREDKSTDHQRLVDEFMKQPELVLAYPPYHDALAAIQRLHAAGYLIHIASARKEPLHQTTIDWLAHHGFADYVTEIHGRSSKQLGHEFKQEVAAKVQAVAAFDDTQLVAETLANSNVMVYLIDRPWNAAAVVGTNIIRVPSFAAGVTRFLEK